jgi:hypothetical protein
MAKYEDNYHDDPIADEPRSSSRLLGIAALICAVVSGSLFVQTTLAGNIRINSGSAIEFGQGISATSACSGVNVLTLTPQASFSNSSGAGAFYLGSITVSNIPIACYGNKFQISAYGPSSSTPLALFDTSATDIVVSDNSGSFSLVGSPNGISVTTNSINSFTATFSAPVATGATVSKISIQSSPSSYSYSPTRGIQFPPISGISISPGINESNAFTVEGWIRSADWSQPRALIPYVGNTCQGLVLWNMDASTWRAGVSCNNMNIDFTLPGSATMQNNEWIYFAFVRDASGDSLYINGVKLTGVSSNNGGSLNLPFSASPDSASIGEWSAYDTANWSSKNGVVGEFRISTIARVASTATSFNPSYATSGKPTGLLSSDASTAMLLRPPVSGSVFTDSSGNQTLSVITTISGAGTPTTPFIVNFG